MLGLQLTVSIAHALIEQVSPVENDPEGFYRQKPKYGFWTSTYREDTHDSAWVEWCSDTNFGDVHNSNWFLLTPSPETRIYTIDSLQDLNQCLQQYGGYPYPELRKIWGGMKFIDFERLAKEYDCINLTERGNAQTHLSYPNNLNGWDCESTLWFRWCFTDAKKLERVLK